jgi:methionine-gamma-lyase
VAGVRYQKAKIAEHELKPETLMHGYGYDASLSEGSVKPPVFLTSSFAFQTAEQGRDFFDHMSGPRAPPDEGRAGPLYSLFNHPKLEIVEDRLTIYEEVEGGLVFASGMAAVATAILAHVRPLETVLDSRLLYGGAEVLLDSTLAPFGVKGVGFTDGLDEIDILSAAARAAAERRIAIIFIEPPSNPINSLVDIALVRRMAEDIARRQDSRPLVCCGNTLLGPTFQSPLSHGADLSLYSLAKFVSGHSDLTGGAILGSAVDLKAIRAIESQLDPHSCWRLARSLETLSLRMERAGANAAMVANFLAHHHKRGAHSLSTFAARRPPHAQADGAAILSGRLHPFLRRQGRGRGSVRLPQSPSALQIGGESRRHGIADLSSDNDSAFRIDGSGSPRNRSYTVVDTHLDRDRASRRSRRRHHASVRMKSDNDAAKADRSPSVHLRMRTSSSRAQGPSRIAPRRRPTSTGSLKWQPHQSRRFFIGSGFSPRTILWLKSNVTR